MRAAGPMHASFTHAGRADEIHLRHHDPARVFFAKQDHARHQKVQIRRTERSWPAHRRIRVVAGTDKIDVGLAVDLAAAKEERVYPALRGEVEQLDAATGKEIVLLRAEHGDAHRARGQRAREQRAGPGHRRRSADRYMGATLQQACDDRDEQLGPAGVTHAAACTPPSHSARNCAMPSGLRASAI